MKLVQIDGGSWVDPETIVMIEMNPAIAEGPHAGTKARVRVVMVFGDAPQGVPQRDILEILCPNDTMAAMLRNDIARDVNLNRACL